MNINLIEHPNRIRSKKKEILSKNDCSKSHHLSGTNSSSATNHEKNLKLRLKELEDINTNLEKVVRQRTNKLTEIVSTNGKFLSIIAHELRSPFSSIIGILEILKLSLNDFNKEEIKEYVDIVYNSANNTLSLLDNLLIWAVSQNKEKSINPVKINLFELLREEIESLKSFARQKQINMSHTVEPGLYVTADLQMVKTILRNLINNAIKYTNINGEICINASELKQFVEITVKDNGIGISAENQMKLFKTDMFHSTPGTHDEKGMGLGLLLCKEFVEMHGGRIWMESAPGKGSRFAFTLPH
jgi:signal transduction histidine kinase